MSPSYRLSLVKTGLSLKSQEHPDNITILSTRLTGALSAIQHRYGIILFFLRLLTEVYPECREKYRCFIMDESGLIMMHNHFVNFEAVSDLETLAQSIGNTHITELEKSVAEDMIKRKLLYRKKCKDFQDITNDNFYAVNVTENLQVTKVCPKYQVTPLKGTTAYLGRLTYYPSYY